MTCVEELAQFVGKIDYGDLSDDIRNRLKRHVLDSIGCQLGAIGYQPIREVREIVQEFGGSGPCTLVGGNKTAPDRAALYNGALLRYLDFMDAYMAKKQSGHPSDNVAPVLAAAEYARRSGKEFMAALAVAYAVECKLLDVLPVEGKGFDHTVQLAYSMPAGIAKALGMDEERTANALAISGAAYQGLVVTRTGTLSQWKGLASAKLASDVMGAVFLARRGITGPLEVMEGKNGLMQSMGEKPKIEWSKDDLDYIAHTSLKRYNAEIHAQSTLEGILELRDHQALRPEEVDKIDITIFKQAFNIIGEGAEAGDKHDVHTKEQADHSLPYLVAVALIDGKVTPEQFLPERINSDDVQNLLKKVHVGTQAQIGKKAFEVLDTYTARYPEEMPVKITVKLNNGQEMVCEQSDYLGFYSKPMSWDEVVAKFDRLAEPHAEPHVRRQIRDAVDDLENIRVEDLTELLAKVQGSV